MVAVQAIDRVVVGAPAANVKGAAGGHEPGGPPVEPVHPLVVSMARATDPLRRQVREAVLVVERLDDVTPAIKRDREP